MAGSIAQGLRNYEEQAVTDFYSRYMPCIYAYARARLRDEAAAQDVAHDSVLAVVRNITQLADDSKFESWMWAIVRHELLSHLRTRQRVVALSDIVKFGLNKKFVEEKFVEEKFVEESECVHFLDIARCSLGGLSLRDQKVLMLLTIHDARTCDLAVALKVSRTNAEKLAARARHRASLSARALDAALHEKRCTELTQVIAQWNGVFNTVWRKRISQHVESCAICRKRKLVSLT